MFLKKIISFAMVLFVALTVNDAHAKKKSSNDTYIIKFQCNLGSNSQNKKIMLMTAKVFDTKDKMLDIGNDFTASLENDNTEILVKLVKNNKDTDFVFDDICPVNDFAEKVIHDKEASDDKYFVFRIKSKKGVFIAEYSDPIKPYIEIIFESINPKSKKSTK